MLQEETPAVADQFGMLLEEAGVEQPFTVAMAEPETDAVAKQCASGCNQQGRPQLQRTQCDQGTDREQRQRGGDERADDEQRVGQRDSEQQPERLVGMGIDRQDVVEGKSVSGSVGFGGRGVIKKKRKNK